MASKKSSQAGLRRHRPKKPFRFEYIKGKFSCLTKKEREARRLDALEDQDEHGAGVFAEWLERRLKAEKESE